MVAVIAVGFVFLGLWQLDRHDEVRLANEEGASRMSAEPVSLDEALRSAAGDYESLRYRQVEVTGEYAVEDEVLIRSRVHPDFGAGFHVVTPLVLDDGSAVLVNRGWIPPHLAEPPVAEAAHVDPRAFGLDCDAVLLPAPEAGEVTVVGWIEPTQERPRFGPTDPPDGRLERLVRIDVERIARQVPYPLAPVYMVARGAGEGLPEPIPVPTFDDMGSHLSYAIQWFSFALIGLVGYGFLMRNRMRQSRARSSTTS